MTVDDVRLLWPGAPKDDGLIQVILDAAYRQCIAFAPTDGDDTPQDSAGNYRPTFLYALALQARNIWNASRVDAGTGNIGGDSFSIQPFPMDWVVKGLLRPNPAIPALY